MDQSYYTVIMVDYQRFADRYIDYIFPRKPNNDEIVTEWTAIVERKFVQLIGDHLWSTETVSVCLLTIVNLRSYEFSYDSITFLIRSLLWVLSK